MKPHACLPILVLAAVMAAGCQRAPASRPAGLSIAEQYGLAYAPLQILRERQLLERRLPGVPIQWHRLGNTAAIREAMLAGQVDVGFVAIPPFLIGRDNGMAWRIFTGLSESPLALVSWKQDLRSLSDIRDSDRLALPQPASVQHILLAMAAERELGDAGRFDRQIVSMSHPDAMAALLARGDVAAHFASPPYLGRELAESGMHVVLTGEEAMGGRFTFIVGVATEKVLARSSPQIAALAGAIEEAAEFIAGHPAEAAALLAPLYGLPAEEIRAGLADEGLHFGPQILGLSAFAGFMREHGFLRQAPEPEERLLWTGAPLPEDGRR